MIINLTPHTVNVLQSDGSIKAYPSEGVARAKQSFVDVGEYDGCVISRTEYGEPENLPEYKEGVLLIVSTPTIKAARDSGRRIDDLVIPADTVRDDKGLVAYAKRLTFV